MKFNLYIPNSDVKKKWEKYAKKSRRSLSDFIRLAVEKEIERLRQEDEIRGERELSDKAKRVDAQDRRI